jgi:hypothetical protein
MGREATCQARWAGGEGEVKARLETHELILRGAHRAHWPLERLDDVRAEAQWLTLTTPQGPLALRLGERDAASWARKLHIPPPTLADKLGAVAGVQVVGEVDDPVLEEALGPHLAPTATAKMTLAVVERPASLDAALAAHAALPGDAPIWILNVKGPKSPLGENAVRSAMRQRGYMDNKTASVSARLAATRYAKAKA